MENPNNRAQPGVGATIDSRWWMSPQLGLELFAIVNIGFLAFDIYLAHSVNQFRVRAEYIPLYFSVAAARPACALFYHVAAP